MKKQQTDYIFFGILGLLMANAIVQSVLYSYILSLNNYLSIISWAIAVILNFNNYKHKRYAVALLLIFGTLNILNFGLGTITVSIGAFAKTPIESPGINPIILVFLIIYYFVNKTSINRLIRIVFHGNEEEIAIKYQNTVDFYYNKFSTCNDKELAEIFKDFNDYPEEAKIALKKIHEQKSI